MTVSKSKTKKPSRARIIRAIATSTAIETGQDAKKLEQLLLTPTRAASSKYKVHLAS